MLKLKEFIDKWKGKHIDFDGIYPSQCMDLMHFYVYEVLGIKDKAVLASPGAKDVYLDFRWGDLFEKIDNTPNGLPEEGDIMFWDTGQWGHVAIYIDGNLASFNSFDANWPVGSLPHIQKHNYSGVLGWLRFKNVTDGNLPVDDELYKLKAKIEDLESELEEMRISRNEWKRKCNEVEEAKLKMETEKQTHIESLQKSLSEMNLQLTNITKQVNTLQSSEKSLRIDLVALETKLKDETDRANKYAEDLDCTYNKITKLSNQLNECQKKLKKGAKNLPFWKYLWLKFKK